MPPPVFGKDSEMGIVLKKGGTVFSVPHSYSSFVPYGRHYLKNTVALLLCASILSISFLLAFPMSALAATLTLDPDSGTIYTDITITGSGFPGNTSGVIWFDKNSNGVKDSLEPYKDITKTYSGDIPSTTLTAPKVPSVEYQVLADIPTNNPVEASADFTIVPGLSLSPDTGVASPVISFSNSGGFAASTDE